MANRPGEVLDLGLFARMIPSGSRPRERFKAAVKAAIGAQAELLDLLACEEAILSIIDIDEKGKISSSADQFVVSEEFSKIARAFYMQAIILYVRATEIRSNHKPKPSYETSFNDDLIEKHHYVMKLRDDAIAHWGPGNDLVGSAHNSITIAGDETGCRTIYSVANYLGGTIAVLQELVQHVLPVCREKCSHSLNEALTAYRELRAAEPNLLAAPLDLNVYRTGDGSPLGSHLGNIRSPSSGG